MPPVVRFLPRGQNARPQQTIVFLQPGEAFLGGALLVYVVVSHFLPVRFCLVALHMQ